MNRVIALLGASSFLTGSLWGQGQVQSYGSGCSSASHSAPVLTTLGTPTEQQTFDLLIQSSPGAQIALLFIGNSAVDLNVSGYPGCHLLVSPTFSLAFTPHASGNTSIPSPGFSSALSVRAQAALGYAGSQATFSNGLLLVGGSAPANPVISQFAPQAGGAGTEITLNGASFDTQNYELDDVVLYVPGQFGFIGRVTGLNSTGAKVKLQNVSKYAAKQPLRLWFGEGEVVVPPTFGSPAIKFKEVRRYVLPPGAPQVVSTSEFDPLGDVQFGACDGCGEGVRIKVSNVDATGAAKIQLPGSSSTPNPLIKGDMVRVTLAMTLSSGKTIIADIGPDLVTKDVSWTSFSGLISSAITDAIPELALSYSATANALTIQSSDPSDPISSIDPSGNITVEFDMSAHQVIEEVRGVIDNFALPIDPSSGDPAKKAAWDATAQGIREYDEASINDALIETFQSFGTGAVRSARIELHLKCVGGIPWTDGVGVGAVLDSSLPPPSMTYSWSSLFNGLPQSGFAWVAGQKQYMCLDLTELQLAGGFTRSVVNDLYDGLFDVIVHDDTAVDYMKLCVVRKKP